jgi:homoserine O-acetyltransferase
VRTVALIVASLGLLAHAHAATPDAEPVQHEFIIENFKTESGTVLPSAHIVYGTNGKLNAKGDNAILLPSHYMAEMHGYGWLIGPGKALDPTKLFLVTSELFGNGRSSRRAPGSGRRTGNFSTIMFPVFSPASASIRRLS